MRPIKTHDTPSITTVDEALDKLIESLEDLLLVSDDVKTAEDRQLMVASIGFMKRYYERIERLLLDGDGDATKSEEQYVGEAVPKQRQKVPWGTRGFNR